MWPTQLSEPTTCQPASEIFAAVEEFYKKFYFRVPKIASIVNEMVRSPDMMKRRLREGVEFYRFLKERQGTAKAA